MVCEIQEGKDNKNHSRITVGANLIFYPGDAGTNTALLELIKLTLNSVISHKGARFSTMDIKNFYLDMSIVDSKYIHIKITAIAKEFILEYDLAGKETTMGGSTLKFDMAAMGYPKLVYWPKISFVDI